MTTRQLLAEALVWPVIIVVGGVLGQDGSQMALAEHVHPVGVLASGGADPAFGMGVGPRSQLHRMRTIGSDVSG